MPVDTAMDPAIRLATRQLRADLVRVHPSFRFEEALAARLAAAADRLKAGLPAEAPPPAVAGGTLAAFRGIGAAGALATATGALATATVVRGLPDAAAHPRRPLIVGGVGVASAAISLGAVYVAWRHSHPTSGRRRSGVINEILGVVS